MLRRLTQQQRQQQRSSLHSSCAAVVAAATVQRRHIIIPNQLKAYGDDFNPSVGDRNTTLVPHATLLTVSSTLEKKRKTRGIESFEEMMELPIAVRRNILEQEFGVRVPSPVQQLAIPELLRPTPSVAELYMDAHTMAATNSDIIIAAAGASASSVTSPISRTMAACVDPSAGDYKSVAAAQRAILGVKADGKGCLVIASPAGTGKTLSYLAPIYAQLLHDRDVLKIPVRENRPRVILMCPTQELIQQLHSICCRFDKQLGFDTVAVTSKRRFNFHWKQLFRKRTPDILICHPRVAMRQISNRRLFIDDLKHLVVDEADTLLSPWHSYDAAALMHLVEQRKLYKHLPPVCTRTVLVTSQLTRTIHSLVKRRYETSKDGAAYLLPPQQAQSSASQQMHLPVKQSIHRFHNVKHSSGKLDYLKYLLQHVAGVEPAVDVTRDDAFEKLGLLKYMQTKKRSGKRSADKSEVVVSPSPPSSSSPADKNESSARKNKEEQPTPSSLVVSRQTTTAAAAAITEAAIADGANPQHKQLQRRNTLVTRIKTEKDARKLRKLLQYYNRQRKHLPTHRSARVAWEHNKTVSAPFTCNVKFDAANAPRNKQTGDIQQRVIIFFRNIDSVIAISNKLQAQGFYCLPLHASLTSEARSDNFRKFASGECNILCATDIAARGLDLPVDRVINFDMSTSIIPYLTRCGRVARMGRIGYVHSLYTKRQRTIVAVLRQFIKKDVPLEGVSNYFAQMLKPRYGEWKKNRMDAITRKYVSMITTRRVPGHLEKTYIRHNATWRPPFHPNTIAKHGGVAPRQQQKLMDKVMHEAVWYRRERMAKKKGGRAKFGRMDGKTWTFKSGATTKIVGGGNPAAPSTAWQAPDVGRFMSS